MRKVISLAPESHLRLMLSPAVLKDLKEQHQLWENPDARHLRPEDSQVLPRLSDCDAILTGWGSEAFSRRILESAPKLKIVAHLAGSVRHLFSDELVREYVIPRGLIIYSGNAGLATNVAEATIGYMIMASHRWIECAEAFKRRKQTGGYTAPNAEQFLTGATVGLVSASKVARCVLPLLRPFGCRILICDPFLSREAAAALGAELCSLDELFERSDIVSIHTPALPATTNMIGARQLKKLKDGAVFINTSRGQVVDHAALLEQCRTQRIVAALDVTSPEPLPLDSEFWELPNVILTPHLAGRGRAGYHQIGSMAVQALRDCFAGRAVEGAVQLERWETLA